jgi:hypothetical protein
MKSHFLLFLLLGSIVIGCDDVGSPIFLDEAPPPNVELIWVGKVFSGGRQCTNDIFTPPETKSLLNRVGIAVYTTCVELYGVHAACGYPTYSAMHSARIRRNQLSQAEGLGFAQIEPTSVYSLYGKWNWLMSVGGIAGWTLTPPPIVRAEYDRSGLFSYYSNDTLIATTTFIVRRERTFMSLDSSDVIHYRDSLRFVPQAFQIDNDTLKLTDLCIDCYGHAYRRIL